MIREYCSRPAFVAPLNFIWLLQKVCTTCKTEKEKGEPNNNDEENRGQEQKNLKDSNIGKIIGVDGLSLDLQIREGLSTKVVGALHGYALLLSFMCMV